MDAVVAKPLPRHESPHWLQWILDLPGRLHAALIPPPLPMTLPEVTLQGVAERATASPRANGYLALEPGLHRLAVGDRGLVAYRAVDRAAFAVGGVQAPIDAVRETLVAFRERLRLARFRRLLLFPVAPAEVEAVEAAGFRAIQVGAEAMLDPREFTLKGPERANLRYMFNKARRRYGVRCAEVTAESHRDQLEPIYRDWLARRPTGHRMRLLVGTPSFDRPFRRRYFAAFVDAAEGPPEAGRAVAFVSLTPGWSDRGFGLDVMARSSEAPAGTMERLLVAAIQQLGEEGVAHFSLGPCPLLETQPMVNPPPWPLRRFNRLLFRSRLANRLFPFRNLAFFKAKFAPDWRPVLIAAWPSAGFWSLYVGCRMWGLFRPPP
jgi:lysylphosphatidylglycerol synthetase-like protein (DUF2156 family)